MRYAARCFIKNNEGLYLTLYQVKQAFYMLPGGKCEPLEQLKECAIRETKEETNLDVFNLEELVRYWWPLEKDSEGLTMAYFIASADLSKLKIMEPHKHSNYKFMTFEQLCQQKNRYISDVSETLKSKLESWHR